MIEMIAISIGIAAPTSVPTTSSSTISAAGSPNCSSPLLRSLADSSVKSRSSVWLPVMCAANPPLPSARSTTEMRSAIRSSSRLGDDDGQHRGVPVGRHQDLAARVQVAGDLRHAAAATDLRRPAPARAPRTRDRTTTRRSERTTMTSSTASASGQPRVDELLRRGRTRGGWSGSSPTSGPSPAASRPGPSTRARPRPTRPARGPVCRVANSASRRGPNPDPESATVAARCASASARKSTYLAPDTCIGATDR